MSLSTVLTLWHLKSISFIAESLDGGEELLCLTCDESEAWRCYRYCETCVSGIYWMIDS